MNRIKKEEFIERSQKLYNNKYDYSEIEYKNTGIKVKIICPEHGAFYKTPINHLNGQGCPICSKLNKKLTTEEFIKRAREVHGDKYDYSKVEYIKSNKKVCIICPIHGEFWQTPHDHLRGCGCPNCAKNKKLTQYEFIERAKYIHNNFYNYSKVVYKNTEEKVCIICPEHGEFWQTPHSHLSGVGCPLCAKCKNINETSLYEFINSHISEKVVREKRFPWLGLKTLDIYIPKYNIAIEYQGRQHFMPLDFFGGEETYLETVKRDKEKYNLCKLNRTKLFYFSKEKNIPNEYFDTIYTDENLLLNEILRNIN